MGRSYGTYAAGTFADELYKRMLDAGQHLVDRDEFPRNPEEFANVVVHEVFNALAGGLMALNKDTGLHLDDPRPDAPRDTPPHA